MPPVYYYRSAAASNGATVDLSDYFRLYDLDVSMNAEEGSVATSTVTADDPRAELDFVGHRWFHVDESTATGSNVHIFTGYTAERVIRRGDFHRVEDARIWDITLTDSNTQLARRIFDTGRAARPAESDAARITWLLGTEEAGNIGDTRYVSLTDTVAMDEADYRGQTVADVINDCAQASGKNWYLWWAEDTEEYSLWYDFAASSNYTSPLRLSNVLADVDETWTFPLSPDTELKRDPSRVFSGIYLPYDGGFVYNQRQSTASNFAYRDGSMPSINVKTPAKATARANRYLSDLDTEEDVITTTILLPAAKVNFLKEGMRVQVKGSHLPGYEDFQWMRCLTRRVVQTSEQFYSVTVELVAPSPAEPTSPVFGIFNGPDGPHTTENGNDLVHWAHPGDEPGPGYAFRPTAGLVEALEDATPPNGREFWGWKVTGTGTISAEFFSSVTGVMVGSYVITWSIRLNGVNVATATEAVSGNLVYLGTQNTVTVTDLAVEPDDELTAHITCTPNTMPFFRTPAGTGQNDERFQVTGGSLA